MISLVDLTQFSSPLYLNKKLSKAKPNSEDKLEISSHPQDLHHPQRTLPRSFQMGDAAPLLSGTSYLYLANYKNRHKVW